MMGKDIERILIGINSVKDASNSSINRLSNDIAYRLISEETHGGVSVAPCSPREVAVPLDASSYVIPIRSAMNSISSDLIKMNSLSRILYTSTGSFNTGYGSPWTELNKLDNVISDAESFVNSHPTIDWVGDKAGLLSLLNKILSMSIDSKWAITYYHDYIQRGYDHVYNGDNPSITFKSSISNNSIGNVDQEYSENVNIKKPSIDPF